ncbi:FAD-dependent oxidoreductase [Oceanispirochaeta sp. M1]|uniref:FAD-dependent oxidoreductase n=1 Tax=Oceanispirochaeta sp. M1 TaxID=2283433 RepID=UPI000E09233D|nr:FAD-dependent oxidoreductase [Oceanispirochaeta sp. M1]NPD71208.1 FAD-dependent oxidoreductase [Oceanispirochaeta sp. M1]RDG33595.1 CoA-disulfide reductase [Oceanispirochaeta sp. M1]
MNKLLIIGGVAAGATAAAKARRLNPDVEITILEAGPDVSFANCGLPYYVGGDIKSRSKLILQSPESFRDQYGVKVVTMTEAVSIDRDNKKVLARNSESGDQTEYEYDKLILAQGGKPFIPGLEGVDKKHVFSLWTLEDMDKINAYIEDEKPETAVVVGGGFIGLEMVEALRKRGLKVSVVELAPHVMSVMEAETAGFIQKEMAAWNIDVHTGRSVTAIADGNVSLDDGQKIAADMVLLSVGVKPTLKLAQDAGLSIGSSGGLEVDEYLQTSDSDIYAGGDMAEILNSVSGTKVRVPLAGPANRQGRIAAINALAADKSEKKSYKGAQGTSIVRVFDAVAGSTGLSLKLAKANGIDAQSIVIRKENHTSYYPGASLVSIQLIYAAESGKVLGAQVYGEDGVDKRLDVLATAVSAGMTVEDLGELDLAYAPPFGSANDPINMAGFTAENRISGYSPSITPEEVEAFVENKKLALIDIRDYFTFQKGHIQGAVNLAPEKVLEELAQVSEDTAILVLDDNGKTAHRVVRQLLQAGYTKSLFISGGYPGIEHLGWAGGLKFLQIPMTPPEEKSLDAVEAEDSARDIDTETAAADDGAAIVVDVRTPGEFAGGAYPDAVNIPLDELPGRMEELGATDREITVYCASGARSAYAARMMEQQGFSRITNGGGLMQMMAG